MNIKFITLFSLLLLSPIATSSPQSSSLTPAEHLINYTSSTGTSFIYLQDQHTIVIINESNRAVRDNIVDIANQAGVVVRFEDNVSISQ